MNLSTPCRGRALWFQDSAGAFRVVREGITGREDLDHQRIGARLARLAAKHLDEFVLAREQDLEGAPHILRARLDAERCPCGLRGACGGKRCLHVVGSRDFDLADRLECCGTAEFQFPARTGDRLYGCYDGHASVYPFGGMALSTSRGGGV